VPTIYDISRKYSTLRIRAFISQAEGGFELDGTDVVKAASAGLAAFLAMIGCEEVGVQVLVTFFEQDESRLWVGLAEAIHPAWRQADESEEQFGHVRDDVVGGGGMTRKVDVADGASAEIELRLDLV